MEDANNQEVQGNNNTQSNSKDGRLWAFIAHISALAGFVFPFGNGSGY